MSAHRRRVPPRGWAATPLRPLRNAQDLRTLADLPEPFWGATAAPASQLGCDPGLLAALDPTGSGRVLSGAVRRSAQWLGQVLRRTEGVDARRAVLELGALNPADPESAALLAAARRVLDNLGAGGNCLALAQVRDRRSILARSDRNGDGIIPADSAEDGTVRALIADIIRTTGSVTDASGSPGVDQALADRFEAAARAALGPGPHPFPLGPATSESYRLFRELAGKLDEYFSAAAAQRFAAGEPPTPLPAITVPEEPAARADWLLRAPLRRPAVPGVLPFDDGLNPAYRRTIGRFAHDVLAPLLGSGFDGHQLQEGAWQQVREAFAPYEQWLADHGEAHVETLERDRLQRDVLSLPALRGLIHRDAESAREIAALARLEQLILLQRWILDLCNNFVGFADLYRGDRRALFEAGSLVIAGRILRLCLRVEDVEAHADLARRSGIFLVYCEVEPGPGDHPFHVAAPVTAGGSGGLVAGRRGVFFSVDGRQSAARVVRVIENPVSLAEAVVAPFRRIAATLGSAVERLSTGTEKRVETSLTRVASSVGQGAQAAPAALQTGASQRLRDTVLAGSVAVAALGSSFAFVAKTASELRWQQILAALAVGAAVVIVPSVLAAAGRLRSRDLAPLLEASGWAINARMRLTSRLCHLLAPAPAADSPGSPGRSKEQPHEPR